MEATTVAIDLAKDVFQVAVANRIGRVLHRQRLTRRQFAAFVETLDPATEVIMESCATSHYWGRRFESRGIRVQLLPVQYVRPYVRRNKTDRTDTDALLEAARSGEIRPVPVKTVEQQTLQALHRVRTQWQTTRVARINGIRGLLAEHGVTIPVGAKTLVRRIDGLLSDPESPVPTVVRRALGLIAEEIRALEARITELDQQLTALADAHPIASRLQTIPGVGVLSATALVGAVTHIDRFRRGRDFASWVGLTPREYSSGTRRYLGRISKRGDGHLRCLLVHGARAVLRSARYSAEHWPDRVTRLHQWALTVEARRGFHKAVVAVANKLARIIWAVWRHEVRFDSQPAVAAA
jgi:transposase